MQPCLTTHSWEAAIPSHRGLGHNPPNFVSTARRVMIAGSEDTMLSFNPNERHGTTVGTNHAHGGHCPAQDRRTVRAYQTRANTNLHGVQRRGMRRVARRGA